MLPSLDVLVLRYESAYGFVVLGVGPMNIEMRGAVELAGGARSDLGVLLQVEDQWLACFFARDGRQLAYVWSQLSFLSGRRIILLLRLGRGGSRFGRFLLLTLLLFQTSLVLTLTVTRSEGVALRAAWEPT